MSEPDPYFLGYRRAEQERHERQAREHAAESAAVFDRTGVTAGWRVVEIAAGPRAVSDYWPSASARPDESRASSATRSRLTPHADFSRRTDSRTSRCGAAMAARPVFRPAASISPRRAWCS